MTSRMATHCGLLILLGFGLSGCDQISHAVGQRRTPEQTCSSQETYDALVGIVAEQVASSASLLAGNNLAARAASVASLKSVISYSSPTVEDVNKTTGKISCQALMRISAPVALIGDQQGLTPNDFGPDHVTYSVDYTVQTTADEGRPLFTLKAATPLAAVAFQAALLTLRKGDDAIATAASPPPEQNASSPEPADEPVQDSQVNAADEPTDAPDATPTADATSSTDGNQY